MSSNAFNQLERDYNREQDQMEMAREERRRAANRSAQELSEINRTYVTPAMALGLEIESVARSFYEQPDSLSSRTAKEQA